MAIIEKIRSKIRHRLVLTWLTDRLMVVGVVFKLFYWVKESTSVTPGDRLETDDFQDFTLEELGYDDMERVDIADADHYAPLDYLQKTISTPGVKCFALTHHGEVACLTWFNLKKCDYQHLQLPLQDNEAYCFDMYTKKSFRGRNLAPYLRLKAMQALKATGTENFYSISDYFNHSSIRFKQKLNCEFLELHLVISLFNKVRFTRRIK